MKYNILTFLLLAVFAVTLRGNDDIRIQANRCLALAQETKTSDREFKAALNAVRRLCKTSEEKKYFEEIRILAETRFKMRPLVTAVLRFTCKDPALAFSVKPAAVAELLETSLDSSFSKITRRDLDKAIEELNLQNSDLFEKSAGTQLGSFVKAQYIITGNIQKMSSQIVITARCIEVASGRIVKDGQIKVKDAGEVTDAIPALARQLSMRQAQENTATLSGYAIKYLNAANRNIVTGNFLAAADDISRSQMFLAEKNSVNNLLALQMAWSTSVCYASQRNYKNSANELGATLGVAKKIFGENDEVVIHYHNALAQQYLHSGNYAKAAEAWQDALKSFERTKEFKNGAANPFSGFEGKIYLYQNKDKAKFNTAAVDKGNNTFILLKFDEYTSRKKTAGK